MCCGRDLNFNVNMLYWECDCDVVDVGVAATKELVVYACSCLAEMKI